MSHSRNADYQAELRRRRKEAGLVQVQVYVHESRRDDIRAVAARMQEPAGHDEAIDVLDETEAKR
ncbi:hypothetical protein [Sphingomonas sp. CV7422]|uniref:hypothetical protein n=1 Tax=Sphingomonas sp. CV7422 TaxID=3018036 RepID=UPI0022FE0925|nr:hypothetical protein [Sphingomonas sp. CV7422]